MLFLFIILGFYVANNFFAAPMKIKVSGLEIANVYRDCTKNANENYRDSTIQTTVNITTKQTPKYSLKLSPEDFFLKIGPNEKKGFSMVRASSSDPNDQGVDSSGQYVVTGGELDGDISDTLTFCYGDMCDVANLEICK